MGFLSKAFKKVKKQIQPGNMIARDMGPGNMPRRPDIFGGNSFLFGRKPDMTSIRMPQKRGGGFGNLGEAIRRLQEKRGGDMGMPRMEGRPINQYMGSPGGTPGFYDREMAKVNPIRPGMDDGRMRAMPIGPGARLQMPEGLPSMEEIQGNRRMPEMDRGRMQPRQMMNYGGEMKGYAEGDEVMMMQENEMMAPNGGDIESMLSGMDSGEQEAMGELEQMAPEMEMIDQLVMMVVQMIQQGAGEEQVISFLREQGLDDEDIGTVLQLVAEMAETEDASSCSK
jgi:hypothetical protein